MGKSGSKLSILLAAGSLWGLSEAGLGMYLRGTCAYTMTGSVMTGIAILFLALSVAYAKRWQAVLIILGVAALFKLLDAFLLGLPVVHGAVINPIFGFLTEALAFIFLFAVLDARLKERLHGRAILGGLSALVAVNLFPLVGYVTSIPACVAQGTQFPLSLYYAPIAVGLSMATCPLGMLLGERLAVGAVEQIKSRKFGLLIRVSAPAVSVICLGVMILLHIG
ncbi:MAG: hypothetical protein FJY66_00820 [Calditrichaeota bacterium]|nr:hypothetical protein [Calditrichota bacterium]